jgi:YjbE family integral membrane protein
LEPLGGFIEVFFAKFPKQGFEFMDAFNAFIAFAQTAEFWRALILIIGIDLVLAGDNAIVIALAARNLPTAQRKQAIIWGTAGAIVVRVLMTGVVVWLLKIPGLMLIGGLLLLWIAVKLLLPEEGDGHADEPAATSFWGAMKTIVIADALMGLDNVLGVAGAAGGHMSLVVIGLLISIPIVVWASGFVLKMIDRYPVIIQIGAAVLAITAAKMIISEPFFGIKEWFTANKPAGWAVFVVCTALVLGLGHLLTKRQSASKPAV